MTVWKMLVPLLDERTVNRVVWVKDNSMLTDYLSENFETTQIPDWMGGKAVNCTLRLYNDFLVQPEQMKGRLV